MKFTCVKSPNTGWINLISFIGDIVLVIQATTSHGKIIY